MKYWVRKDSFSVVPENLEDLWVLSEIIKPGDIVGAKTLRKLVIDYEGRKEVENVSTYLKIKVKKVSFDKFALELKLLGEIVESKDFKGHHTIRVGIGKRLDIFRELGPEEEELLKENIVERPRIVIVAVDSEEAAVFDSKTGEITVIEHKKAPKDSDEYEQSLKSFLGKVKAKVEEIGTDNIVIAGPGFVKEKLRAILGKGIVVGTSYGGEAGIREVLRRKDLEKVFSSVREAKEESAVEKIYELIAKGGKVAYGIKDVLKAVDEGRVELLLVSRDFIRDFLSKGRLSELREIMKKVKYARGNIFILFRNEDAIKKLNGLGGVAAVLRW